MRSCAQKRNWALFGTSIRRVREGADPAEMNFFSNSQQCMDVWRRLQQGPPWEEEVVEEEEEW